MKELNSICTPTGEIKIFKDDDSKLWIQQNNLTRALGYNKFLSLSYSRLGQFISKAHAVKKHGNRNLLDLQKVVELVLPAFLKGFFREINGQPSRRQFFGKDPTEIFHNAKQILAIMKGVLMSYDPKSIEAQKGALGEKIVKQFFEDHDYQPTRPDDAFKSGASIVDFTGIDGDGVRFYAEVKVQIAKPYGVENAPCYAFPKSRIDAYTNYKLQKNAPLDMFVVDPSTGFGYFARLDTLERETCIDTRVFPFDQEIESIGGTFHYWHRSQFNNRFAIPYDDLIELRKLYGIEESIPPTPWSNFEVLEPKQEETASAKSLVEKLATFVNIGKADLTQSILDLRQKKFDREQAQMKELLL